ncbi:cytochrome ubiquinol oxidase subunit I [Paenibacillus hexagrammi]|uniref:Cytochrome ubiquinol oxidase subunit I n=1 Tax=Paenibacillus hexagrammi TaxID=2908839 RepID=A0ABY3SNC0_9BACL|nr:cytochrome ubiquinol oxidase subunit I [Paenibacillus sp. YPD9-1]UJF34935.1 cytochrome ubiquinol oxidase subunit I [Paenibacillus sp. YPD9-1]
MDTVMMARSLFGSSMAFHIIFATLGVGIPLLIVLAELLFQFSKDPDFAIMAKRWTRGFAILLGVAIPSGTIVGVMLALLWPGFMEYVGQVIALPFQVEIWAFFLEALFMSIYVYAADRLHPWMRIVSVIFVAIGASASAVLITNVHAWMNTPRGFNLVNGQITDVDPWAAVMNPSFFITSLHVLSSAYMTGAFAVASVGAFKLLSKRKSDQERSYHGKSLFLSLLVGGIMSLITAIGGHETAQMLHHHQPEKLAAAEGLFETRTYAPLAIGGNVDEETQSVRGGIEIPWALSFLATNHFDGVVRGLNEFPRDEWPPLYIHTLFNAMVGIGSLLIVLSFGPLAYRLLLKRKYPRWLLWVLVTSGPLSMIGIETGWIFSCTGRQPWTIYHVQRTAEAATKAEGLGMLFVLFLSIYAMLLVITSVVMWVYFKRHPVVPELLREGA